MFACYGIAAVSGNIEEKSNNELIHRNYHSIKQPPGNRPEAFSVRLINSATI